MLRRIVGRAAVLASLVALPGAAVAGEPFHGYFQPRGGDYYTPLHFWAPALYRVQFLCKGPECPGCPVSVCPPHRPACGPAVSPAFVTPPPPARVPVSGCCKHP
jgi:hypothetical protein